MENIDEEIATIKKMKIHYYPAKDDTFQVTLLKKVWSFRRGYIQSY